MNIKETDIVSQNPLANAEALIRIEQEKTRNSVPITQIAQRATTADWLSSSKFKKSLSEVLPVHLNADRIARIALTELKNTDKLQKCSIASFLGAIMTCSQLGLEIGNTLGHAYLIPYGSKCQFMVGYKGLMDLAFRSGRIATIQAQVVRQSDDFHFEYGMNEDLKHIPAKGRGEIIYAYAYVKTNEGKFTFDVMSKEEIDDIKNVSESSSSPVSPWNKYYSEMARKTVIRRLFKYLPVSNDLSRAIALDEAADRGEQRNENTIDLTDYEITEN